MRRIFSWGDAAFFACMFLLLALTYAVANCATFSQVTPNRGGLMCDTSRVIARGLPRIAHVRLTTLSGGRLWEDSVATRIGSEWSLTHANPTPGAYLLVFWYSTKGDAVPGCPRSQPWAFAPRFTVDLNWDMRGAVFDNGRWVSPFEVRDMLDSLAAVKP